MKQRLFVPLIRFTRRIMDTNKGKFASVPDLVIALSGFMAMNAIAQVIADVVIEGLSMAGIIVKMPLRLEFLFLAVISAFLGYFTLQGLRNKEIDVTQNSLTLGLLVETFLVIGDMYFLLNYPEISWTIVLIRMPFIVFTSLNIAIILYIVWRMHIFRRQKYPLKF